MYCMNCHEAVACGLCGFLCRGNVLPLYVITVAAHCPGLPSAMPIQDFGKTESVISVSDQQQIRITGTKPNPNPKTQDSDCKGCQSTRHIDCAEMTSGLLHNDCVTSWPLERVWHLHVIVSQFFTLCDCAWVSICFVKLGLLTYKPTCWADVIEVRR